MSRLNIDDYTGAIAVLENYLEGAIADYEKGDTDNDKCIWDSIRTLELLTRLSEPLLCLVKNEYRIRMEKVSKKND